LSRRLRLPRGRRRSPSLVLLLIIAVVIIGGVPYVIAGNDARRADFEPRLTELPLPAGMELARLPSARVTEVIDGDTIEVLLDGQRLRLRYFGVDTPERGDKCYREALDRNQALLAETVLLLADGRDTDRFGRLLRYVFLSDGTSVDATLVAEGFGRAWRDDGRYRDQIVGLEAEAEAADRGCLWR
jgi:endonuclease YncB( thermonuclease family)